MVAHHVPTSISAVESQRISIIYYARANGELASLTAQKPGESPNYPPYESANVIKKGNVVVATVPQVAAIAYTLNDTPEVSRIDGTTSATALLPSFSLIECSDSTILYWRLRE